jgi:flavin reductase (DIM6/NTAB) family NADH-FMN oxidoreductase RutF
VAEADPEPVSVGLGELAGRDRYRLLTTLVVPRPIAWASTWSPDGTPNLAPFSYFAALSSTPALIGISIGSRSGSPKDTLENIRASGAVCVNVVTMHQLDAMNRTSEEVGPGVNEFLLAGLEWRQSPRVDAPYVVGCPAVLECELRKEMGLPGSSNVLVVAEVIGVRLAPNLLPDEGYAVDPERLRPIGRMGGDGYMLPDAFRWVPRPR